MRFNEDGLGTLERGAGNTGLWVAVAVAANGRSVQCVGCDDGGAMEGPPRAC